MAQFLAGDVNNDGIVSYDDNKYIMYYVAGIPIIDLKEIQLSKIDNNITNFKGYLYTWVEVEKDLIAVLQNKGFDVDSNAKVIRVDVGTTYIQLENSIKDVIPIDEIDFYDSNDDEIENKNSAIIGGELIDIWTQDKVVGTEYYFSADAELEIELKQKLSNSKFPKNVRQYKL